MPYKDKKKQAEYMRKYRKKLKEELAGIPKNEVI